MIRHTTETNGLNRSPITDAFRSVPHNPCRWLSNSDGLIPCMYVHVHMKRIHTVIKLLRSKIADCMCEWCVGPRCRRRYYSRSAYHRFKIISLSNEISRFLNFFLPISIGAYVTRILYIAKTNIVVDVSLVNKI